MAALRSLLYVVLLVACLSILRCAAVSDWDVQLRASQLREQHADCSIAPGGCQWKASRSLLQSSPDATGTQVPLE